MHVMSGPDCPVLTITAKLPTSTMRSCSFSISDPGRRSSVSQIVESHCAVPCIVEHTGWLDAYDRRSCRCDRQIRAVRPTRNMHSCSLLNLIRVVVRVCPRSWNPIVPCLRALHRRTSWVARRVQPSIVPLQSSHQGRLAH